MRKTLRFATLALALVSQHATGQAPSPGEERKPVFTMHISQKQSTVKPGADVVIDVAIVNTTDKQITVASSSRPHGFDVSYRADKATRLPVKRRAALPGKDGRVRIYPDRSWAERIAPGGTLHDTVAITELFDLSKPGEYAIRLQRNDTETNRVVTSNTVVLTVTSDSP